jgi:hypothetical protein
LTTRPRRWHEVLKRLPSGPCHVVEVGVWRGQLCREVLRERRDAIMTLVDPWEAGKPGEPWYESGSKMARCSQAEVDQVMAEALESIRFAIGRWTVLKATSVQAASLVLDGSVDLVFIDADHSYEGVKADIEAWLPKVKAGGWIGGHDYKSPRFPGVERAVRERFDQVEHGANSTWFWRMIGWQKDGDTIAVRWPAEAVRQ